MLSIGQHCWVVSLKCCTNIPFYYSLDLDKFVGKKYRNVNYSFVWGFPKILVFAAPVIINCLSFFRGFLVHSVMYCNNLFSINLLLGLYLEKILIQN